MAPGGMARNSPSRLNLCECTRGTVPANRTWSTDAYTLIYQHRTMTRDRAIAEALDALIEHGPS